MIGRVVATTALVFSVSFVGLRLRKRVSLGPPQLAPRSKKRPWNSLKLFPTFIGSA